MRWSAHISWLFAERPYLERVGAARRAGFRTIESAWPEGAEERSGLAAAVAEHGVAVALLNCPAGDTAGGERGFVNDDSRREEAERGFAETLALAGAIGAPGLNLLVGRALPNVSDARQRAAVLAALRSFAPLAADAGVRILLEPLNAIENPGFLAPTPDAVVALIEDVGDDRIGLLLDVYHVARVGDDPADAIARHGERIGHVQVSDHPGRGAPGTGQLDFAAIFERLAASGYDGAVGLEYEPRGPTEPTLAFRHDSAVASLIADRKDV
ncbi:MAG TPA: TIM barrel protein [Solirubrobacteraceae bacterium]